MSREDLMKDEEKLSVTYEDYIYDPMGFMRGVVVGVDGKVGWALFDELEDPYISYHDRLDEIPYYTTMLGEGCGDLLLPPGVQVMEITASKSTINQTKDLAISRMNDNMDKLFMEHKMTMVYLSNGETCMVRGLEDNGMLGSVSSAGTVELKQLLKSIRKAVVQAWKMV